MESDTKCWTCRRATDASCMWSKCFQPVDGWDAEERYVLAQSYYKGRSIYRKLRSYRVISCPMYEWDGRSIVPKEERRRKKEKPRRSQSHTVAHIMTLRAASAAGQGRSAIRTGIDATKGNGLRRCKEAMKQSSLLKMVRAEVNRQLAERTAIHTQMCMDAAMISANEVFNLWPTRVDKFQKSFNDALMEIAEMTVSDTKDIEYTKAKLDERLKKICGDNFKSWDDRYGS